MIDFSICLMIIVSRVYFEITFISRKKDCADRPFEIIYISISGQHNLLKGFDALRFEMIDDYRLQMRGTKFSSTKLFWSGKTEIFY